MSLIEDSIGLLVERGEYRAAADAAEALVGALDAPNLAEERRHRLENALATLSRGSELAEVARALRMFAPGSPEHESCSRLLDSLGARAVGPLLEVLADEPDMTARKTLVDLISESVGTRVDDLGERVSDGRWYFVRNVVAILGKTRSPEAVPYLRRTMRHSDARVRRETVRALAGIPDRMASEMLIACLEDPDAQNVQLTARYLGSRQIRGAVPALEQVARGEGSGNRETGPRVEAIEALGRLHSTSSVPLLQQLAGRRSLIGASRTRELGAAAERALAVIGGQRPAQGGGGA
jgi:HEAT repeat protein